MQSIETKMFGVRGNGTFYPVVATKLYSEEDSEQFLLDRAGFRGSYVYILLNNIGEQKTNYDPYRWNNSELTVAHKHIEKNFDSLMTGEIIDTQYLEGKVSQPRKSI